MTLLTVSSKPKKKIFKKSLKKKKIVKKWVNQNKKEINCNPLLFFFLKLKKKVFKKKLKKFKFNFKFYLKFQKKKLLLILKKKRFKKKLKKKKKDFFFKIFFLEHYSLLHLIKLKKKPKNFFIHKKSKYLLYITVKSNNIFINFLRFKNNKIKFLKFWSSGLFSLNCTKRKLKFILYTFLKEIKKKLKYTSFYLIKIFCARFLNKFLYKNFKKLFLKSKFIIFASSKIFNGCRSKKKRRKKHLKFQILR
jgi:hypothetical protein